MRLLSAILLTFCVVLVLLAVPIPEERVSNLPGILLLPVCSKEVAISF